MIKSWKCLICVFIFSCKKKKVFRDLNNVWFWLVTNFSSESLQPSKAQHPRPRPEGGSGGGESGEGDGASVSDRCGGSAAGGCPTHTGAAQERWHQGPEKMSGKWWHSVQKSSLKLNSGLIFLRFGCWRETNWRRRRASPKAPIWSPGARTSTSSNRYALLCFDSSSRCYDTTWIIVLCGPWAGLQQRRGSSGAQRLQKETRLRSGHLWRLLRGATEQIRTPQQNRSEHNTWWHQSVQQMMLRDRSLVLQL